MLEIIIITAAIGATVTAAICATITPAITTVIESVDSGPPCLHRHRHGSTQGVLDNRDGHVVIVHGGTQGVLDNRDGHMVIVHGVEGSCVKDRSTHAGDGFER